MSEYVADASAVLAYARGEAGEKKVAALRDRCVISSLNLLEAFSKLVRYGMPAAQVRSFLRETFPDVAALDRELAEQAAILHADTRKLGFSYADCVCLSLGKQLGVVVLTADKRWPKIHPDIEVELIR